MNGMWLGLYILSSALSIAVSVSSKVFPDKKWKKYVVPSLGCSLFLVLVAMGLTTYRDNQQSRKQAKDQAQLLSTEVVSLKDQNRSLGDQIGDCNARVEALTTKFHAPAHLTRGVSETFNTQDSVTMK